MPISTIGANGLNRTQDFVIDGLTVGQGSGNVATNTAVGVNALLSNTSGANNTVVGSGAMADNTSGSLNTAMGRLALNANTTGANNTGLGYQALALNTTATRNTAVGYQAGYALTTGGANVVVGDNAFKTATTADNTVAIGTYALENSTGIYNTAVGAGAGGAITTGAKNSILGRYNGNQGGLDIRTASNYIVLSDGDGNPRGIFDGSGNVLVGGTNNADVTSNQTPKITSQPTSNTNTTIQGFPVGLALRNTANAGSSGYGIAMKFHFSGGEAGKYSAIAGVADGTYANQTALAFYTNPNGTNGADNTVQRMYIASNGSIGAPSGTNIYNASDARVKQNINDLPVGLTQIMQLRPVSYNWKEDFCKEENGKLLYGFVAQETQAVDETLIEAFGSASVYYKGENEELVEVTNPLRVNEKFIVPVLVKAIQELNAKVEALEAKLASK